jgi:hypothetical protein
MTLKQLGWTACLCTLALQAQAVGHPSKKLEDQIAISVIDPALKGLPLARWKTAVLPPVPPYPSMARMAKVEGELMMHVQIGPDGKAVKTRLVSGPGPLASTLDSWIRGVRFKPLPEDGPGPWHFAVSARFTLPGQIQIFPTAVKLLPAGSEQ